MAVRTIQLTATTDSSKYLEFGFPAGITGTFSIQAYITRVGARSIDCLCPVSLGFLSLMGGNIYIHNDSSAQRCTLFGQKQDFKIGLVANEEPSQVKILNSLGIKTDSDKWEVESVTVPFSKSHPHGMYSVIPQTAFVKRNDMISADFKRNMKTSSDTISYIEAITGEPLRGNCAYILLKNTDINKVELWEVQIDFSKSR